MKSKQGVSRKAAKDAKKTLNLRFQPNDLPLFAGLAPLRENFLAFIVS
jgi:hypothetical protein